MYPNHQSLDQVGIPFPDGASSRSESDATVEAINPSNETRLITLLADCDADGDREVASTRRVSGEMYGFGLGTLEGSGNIEDSKRADDTRINYPRHERA
jgi:hypothetical protein